MSEETRFEDEIVKSLHKLDEILSKAQIQSGEQSDVSWPTEGEEYDSKDDTKWDDDIDDNGTDYVVKGMEGAGGRKSDEDEEEAEADDMDKAYGGMRMGMGKGRHMDKAKNGKHGDEDDDEEMDKANYGGMMQSPVRKGVEVSEFLNELTKSIVVYCSQLEDTVEKSLQQMHFEQGEMAKAIAHNLDVLSDVLSKSESNITQYADGPARGPKSMLDMSKSVGETTQTDALDKSLVLNALMKGVEAGTVSPLEVIKCEQLGVQAVSHDVVKSLLA